MSEEQQAAAQNAADHPATPDQPKHTKRHRSRKEPAEPAVLPSGPEIDVSERALKRRSEIKSRPWYGNTEHGIRIVTEEEIAPGETARRIRIEFDKKPPKEERDIVKREGFQWAGDVEAWTMANGPKARELAKKAVNLVYKERGIDTNPVMTPMAARF